MGSGVLVSGKIRSLAAPSRFLFEVDSEGGVLFEEDFMGAFGEESWERRAAVVDENEISWVVIHELVHGAESNSS